MLKFFINYNAPDGIRTHDLQLRRLSPYPDSATGARELKELYFKKDSTYYNT